MNKDYDGGEERRRFNAMVAADKVERIFALLLFFGAISYAGTVILGMFTGAVPL